MTEMELNEEASVHSSDDELDQEDNDNGYEMNSDEELQEAFAAGLIQPGLTRLVPKPKERPKINDVQGLKQKLAELKPTKVKTRALYIDTWL